MRVAPTITSLGSSSSNPQFILPDIHGVGFTGIFTDSGWLDSHTASWDYGDGTIEAGTVAEENMYPDSTGTITGLHTFTKPGTYTVELTVTDDGGQDVLTLEVTVVTVEEAVMDLDDYIQGLDDSAFDKKADNKKNTLANKFSAIQDKLTLDEYIETINQLTSIRSLMDGEGKDWITNPSIQSHLLMKIDDIITYLYTLI